MTHGADCARLRVTHDTSSKVRCAGPLVTCDCAPLTVYTVGSAFNHYLLNRCASTLVRSDIDDYMSYKSSREM